MPTAQASRSTVEFILIAAPMVAPLEEESLPGASTKAITKRRAGR